MLILLNFNLTLLDYWLSVLYFSIFAEKHQIPTFLSFFTWFGQFKRMVFGIYHQVSKKYIQRYIDEATMRWNTRKASETTRFQMMFEASLGVFDYSMVRMENNQVILPNIPLTNSIVELVG